MLLIILFGLAKPIVTLSTVDPVRNSKARSLDLMHTWLPIGSLSKAGVLHIFSSGQETVCIWIQRARFGMNEHICIPIELKIKKIKSYHIDEDEKGGRVFRIFASKGLGWAGKYL